MKSQFSFLTANKEDIPELIRFRIIYIADDYGSVNESERRVMEEQLAVLL